MYTVEMHTFLYGICVFGNEELEIYFTFSLAILF